MIRLGMVGLGSAHMTQFADHVAAGLLGEARLTHAVREQGEFADQLAAQWGLEWVDSPEELAERVDAAFVGGKVDSHRAAHATPLLEAGLPVLVDKPLANNREDVDRILSIGGRLLTASALRYYPGIPAPDELPAPGADQDPVVISGNGERHSPWSGLLFHGLHVVELAATALCGDQPPVPTELRRVDADTVSVVLGGRRAHLRLLTDTHHYQVGDTRFSLQPGYLAGLVRAFRPLAHGGPAPLSAATMRATLDLVFDCIDLLEES